MDPGDHHEDPQGHEDHHLMDLLVCLVPEAHRGQD